MIDSEIRENLSRYLEGAISLREFEDWFLPGTWNIHRLGDQSAQNLAYGIGLLLAEFSNRDWTENELRQQLKAYIDSHPSSAELWLTTVPKLNINMRFLEFGKMTIEVSGETRGEPSPVVEERPEYSFPVSTAFSAPIYQTSTAFTE